VQLKNETMLVIGLPSLSVSIVIGRFLYFEHAGFAVSDFVEGLLLGLSLVMNLAYLIRTPLRKTTKPE